jgi:predicted glycosyl hydrolase (DUF1957 family)
LLLFPGAGVALGLDRFSDLVQHENVELVAVELTGSVVSLWDIHRVVAQMVHAADHMEALFGTRPTTADTSGLRMSDVVYRGAY